MSGGMGGGGGGGGGGMGMGSQYTGLLQVAATVLSGATQIGFALHEAKYYDAQAEFAKAQTEWQLRERAWERRGMQEEHDALHYNAMLLDMEHGIIQDLASVEKNQALVQISYVDEAAALMQTAVWNELDDVTAGQVAFTASQNLGLEGTPLAVMQASAEAAREDIYHIQMDAKRKHAEASMQYYLADYNAAAGLAENRMQAFQARKAASELALGMQFHQQTDAFVRYVGDMQAWASKQAASAKRVGAYITSAQTFIDAAAQYFGMSGAGFSSYQNPDQPGKSAGKSGYAASSSRGSGGYVTGGVASNSGMMPRYQSTYNMMGYQR